jgi:hypothetical protein
MEAALILGTYAITLALRESDGPFGLLYRLRKVKAVNSFGVLNCHLCTAFWVSLALCAAFGMLWMTLVAWGASTLIDKLVKAVTVR